MSNLESELPESKSSVSRFVSGVSAKLSTWDLKSEIWIEDQSNRFYDWLNQDRALEEAIYKAQLDRQKPNPSLLIRLDRLCECALNKTFGRIMDKFMNTEFYAEIENEVTVKREERERRKEILRQQL